jgi:hypothetical protein
MKLGDISQIGLDLESARHAERIRLAGCGSGTNNTIDMQAAEWCQDKWLG